MSAKKLRIAIIGTGMIANAAHLPAWKNLRDDVELVAVADLNVDRARLVAAHEGIPGAYSDWRRLLAEAEPDLVSICTPNVHQLDTLFWLLGNPKVQSVSAMTFTKFGHRDEGLRTSLAESGAPMGVLTPRPFDHREFDVEDMAAGFIRLEGGTVVNFKISWAANIARESFNTLLLGSEGGLTLDPLVLATNLGSYQVDVTPKVPADRAVPFSGHWAAAEHILRVIRGQAAPLIQRAEVLNVMRTLDAIYRSAAEGKEVWIE